MGAAMSYIRGIRDTSVLRLTFQLWRSATSSAKPSAIVPATRLKHQISDSYLYHMLTDSLSRDLYKQVQASVLAHNAQAQLMLKHVSMTGVVRRRTNGSPRKGQLEQHERELEQQQQGAMQRHTSAGPRC